MILPFNSGFMSTTASAAVSDLNLPTSFVRKRNCRFRLLFSIVSRSVTKIWPCGPVPSPIILQFFSISQPMAPLPTKNSRVLAMRSWNFFPNTAICPSYRDPIGANSDSGSDGTSFGKASSTSTYMCCKRGWNLPLHAFSTSCATKPPINATIGDKSPVAWKASSVVSQVASLFASSPSGSWPRD